MLRRSCKRKHGGPIAEDGLKGLEHMVVARPDSKRCIREGMMMALICSEKNRRWRAFAFGKPEASNFLLRQEPRLRAKHGGPLACLRLPSTSQPALLYVVPDMDVVSSSEISTVTRVKNSASLPVLTKSSSRPSSALSAAKPISSICYGDFHSAD